MTLWRLTVAASFWGILLLANVSKALTGQSPNPGNVATDEPENTKGSSASRIRIVCPAISQDERRRTNYPGETMLPVDLVVLGTARTVVDPGPNEGVYEATVDRVLYGAASAKAVRFNFPWQVDGKPHVFALTSAPDATSAPYELKYELDADEAQSQMALSAARLDFHALSAACIFVGKQLAVDNDSLLSVEVTRSLAGASPAAGERITLQQRGYVRMSDKLPDVRGDPMIYFIRNVRTDPRDAGKRIYQLDTRLPVDQEASVVAALKRANEYPVIERKDRDGITRRTREILFRGTTAEAIDLMQSASEATVTLAARTLQFRGKDAEAAVVEAAERDLLRQSAPGRAGFRRLHHLIQLLGAFALGGADANTAEPLPETKSPEPLRQLVETYMTHVAGGPPEPATPVREKRETYWQAEAEHDDVNHALAWLLLALDEHVAVREYGRSLLQLRDATKGRWRDEVQLALDATGIEDDIELESALGRMKDIKPLRVTPSFSAAGGAVAFSQDGRFLAADRTVWNVSDWSRAGGFDLGPASIYQVTFSADANSLYVFGGGTGRQVHARYDWRTEKVAQAFNSHKRGVFWGWLSADGRTMASASFYEQIIRIWDPATGKVVRTFSLPEKCFHVAISPDGSTIVRQTAEHLLKVEPLVAKPAPVSEIQLPDSEANEIAFSPDGRSLICSMFSSWDPARGNDVVELRLYDAIGGFQLKTSAFISARRCTGLAVAPNNKFMVMGDQEGRAWVLSLPDLKIVRQLLVQKSNFNISSGSIAFSPDGQLLAIGSNDEPVHLFNAVTWEPISPGAGHKGEISDISFTNDGHNVRTIGKDNTICLWDAATMKLLKQTPVPDGYCVGAVRPPDGQIILCPTFSGYDRSVVDGTPASSAVKVFDADAGKVVAELNLPVHWTYRGSKVLWLNDSQALSLDEGHWRRFDYRTGKILDTRSIDIRAQNELFNGLAEVVEDGKTLLSISGGGKISELNVLATDVATGKSTHVGQTTLPSFTGNRNGLVPGGKYFYVGGPGLYLYDRNTLKPALARHFTGSDLLALAFNRDGSRFAVVTGGRILINGNLQQRDPGTQSIVRVHETATGKILFAFPSSARWVRQITFDPDGRRLALALEGGTIEVWNLPDGPVADK